MYVNTDAERLLVQDTSQAELDYIAARAMEAQLAEEAGSAGGVEAKAATAAEEEELARWAAAAGGASSAGTEAPLVEEAADESSEEEAGAVDPLATGRGRVLWRAGAARQGRAAAKVPGGVRASDEGRGGEEGGEGRGGEEESICLFFV